MHFLLSRKSNFCKSGGREEKSRTKVAIKEERERDTLETEKSASSLEIARFPQENGLLTLIFDELSKEHVLERTEIRQLF